jgi:hypothetical protein
MSTSQNTATSLRWLIDNRWGAHAIASDARKLASSLVEGAKNTIDRDTAFTLRWFIDNRWGDASALADVQAIIDGIVGFPPPERATTFPVFKEAEAAEPAHPIYKDWDFVEDRPNKDVIWLVPPGKSFPIVGVAFTVDEFAGYLGTILDEQMTWSPTAITIHHAAAPSLAQRPQGFVTQHMLNLRSYYQSLGWSRGPHFFVDDRRIWVFSPPTARGIHAIKFNSRSFGFEMLGNYDLGREDPTTGRGKLVTELTAAAVVLVRRRFEIKTPIQFHRDDPATKKSCPGTWVEKPWFNALVDKAAAAL